MSNSLLKNDLSVKQSNNHKYKKELIKKATKSELIFKDRLKKAGIRFIFQKGFIAKNYHCIVDFYLPKPYKICIEIDGGYHDTEQQKKKDYSKDLYLKSR